MFSSPAGDGAQLGQQQQAVEQQAAQQQAAQQQLQQMQQQQQAATNQQAAAAGSCFPQAGYPAVQMQGMAPGFQASALPAGTGDAMAGVQQQPMQMQAQQAAGLTQQGQGAAAQQGPGTQFAAVGPDGTTIVTNTALPGGAHGLVGGSGHAGGAGGAGGSAGGGGSVVQKPGDWICPGCSDLQFAKNIACRKCGTPNPNPAEHRVLKPGDWYCPICNDLQFARNCQCRKCGTANPNPQPPMTGPGSGVPPKGMTAKPGDWVCPGCNDFQFSRNVQCKRCGTPNPSPQFPVGSMSMFSPKPGDWHCPLCQDLQFARNMQCRRCGTPHPGPGTGAPAAPAAPAAGAPPGADGGWTGKPGDWRCPSCGDLVFSRNPQCRRCHTPNPNPTESHQAFLNLDGRGGDPRERPGDWYCPMCKDLQFARNHQCHRCGTPNPNGNFKAGDWVCPSCHDFCFASREFCRRCQTPKPVLPGMRPVPGGHGAPNGRVGLPAGASAAPSLKTQPSDQVYVTGLPPGLTEERLKDVFQQYAIVKMAKILPSPHRAPTARALVQSEKLEDAVWLVQNLSGNLAKGLGEEWRTPLRVEFFRSHQPPDDGRLAGPAKAAAMVATSPAGASSSPVRPPPPPPPPPPPRPARGGPYASAAC